MKAYRLYEISTRRVFASRDVYFVEDSFLFQTLGNTEAADHEDIFNDFVFPCSSLDVSFLSSLDNYVQNSCDSTRVQDSFLNDRAQE